MTDISHYEKFQPFANALYLYKTSLKKQVGEKFSTIISLVEKYCLPLAESSESTVFWEKIIADYYRYSAESAG